MQTKHMYGILNLFTAIKYFPKNYKGIIILRDGVTKLKVHGIETIAAEIQKQLIELHNVLYVPDITSLLYCIIEHGSQPDCSFVIKNGATTVGFPTFTLLDNTNKDMILDSDIPFKDRHSHRDYTNLLNDFNNTPVSLIYDKAAIPKRYTEDFVAYNLHCVEQVSIKVLTPTLHVTESKLFISRGEGDFSSTEKACRTDITATAPLLLNPLLPTKSSP